MNDLIRGNSRVLLTADNDHDDDDDDDNKGGNSANDAPQGGLAEATITSALWKIFKPHIRGIGREWSSILLGYEGWIDPSRKLLCYVKP